MYSVFAPVFASHCRRSWATNSGPLSERRCSGTPFQLRVLLLQLLQPFRLVHLEPTVFLAPTEIRLLDDPSFLRGLRCRLPVRYGHFDLPQQIHHLLRLVLLASSHMLSLSSVSLIHWHISSRALHRYRLLRQVVTISSPQHWVRTARTSMLTVVIRLALPAREILCQFRLPR